MNMKLALNRFFLIVLPEKKTGTGHDFELKHLIRSLKKNGTSTLKSLQR
ncbi:MULTISPECIES: hypothetical protein [unclassified Oceanispirochaeta]|nr:MULTISPECIES: hypothetical protein [unclassified Oceanispirochaeta]MBF9014678.1 hypothetical protein [Oceanispirochaeta sp. M2]NPD70934.1 hypothetical protein [Oceanispirochaeta sp. M1]